MRNLIDKCKKTQNDSELIQIPKNELKSLYRKIIECEKIIQEYQEKERKLLNLKSNFIE